MANIYVRVPHYVASYMRNRDEGNIISPETPIRIETGDRLMYEIIAHAEPNLRNVVNVNCFSERQWVAMLQGKTLVYTDDMLTLDRHRDVRQPLTLAEIYTSCGRMSYIKYIDADDGTKQLAPDEEYVETYLAFQLPSRIVRNGREVKIQSDWFIPNPSSFIGELIERYKDEMYRFLSVDQRIVHINGDVRSKMESMDRFMLRYDIRTGVREREQMKKMIQRDRRTARYALDSDDEHGRWCTDNADLRLNDGRGANRRPIFCIETGQTFPSMMDFAKTYGIKHRSQVSNALRNGYKCHGMTIVFADSDISE